MLLGLKGAAHFHPPLCVSVWWISDSTLRSSTSNFILFSVKAACTPRHLNAFLLPLKHANAEDQPSGGQWGWAGVCGGEKKMHSWTTPCLFLTYVVSMIIITLWNLRESMLPRNHDCSNLWDWKNPRHRGRPHLWVKKNSDVTRKIMNWKNEAWSEIVALTWVYSAHFKMIQIKD